MYIVKSIMSEKLALMTDSVVVVYVVDSEDYMLKIATYDMPSVW